MAHLRLYRQFYLFSNVQSETSSKVLFDPYYLSASTFIVSSSTVIESFVSAQQESTGIYYVDLNPNLYSHSNIYELKWYVNYIDSAPIKMLPTRFKFNPINVGGGQIELELEQYPIEIEIAGLGF